MFGTYPHYSLGVLIYWLLWMNTNWVELGFHLV
jgi:hypothetical protein